MCSFQGKWIIKTESGYIIQDNAGSNVQFFVMAADSKAFLMGESYKYLTKSSPLEDKLMYTTCTGKALWFDTEQWHP